MQNKIIKILSDITEDTALPDWATGKTSIINDVGLDSLQLVMFILTLEDEFAIEIRFDEFDFKYLDSIDVFSSFISESLNKKAQS